MNLFKKIKRDLNILIRYSECSRDMERTRVMLKKTGELLGQSWKEYPELPPDKSPYGKEINRLLGECETLQNKWRSGNDTAQ